MMNDLKMCQYSKVVTGTFLILKKYVLCFCV